MITSSKQIVWTPMFSNGAVAVALDTVFANECKKHPLEQGEGQVLAVQVWRFMGNAGPIIPSNFLDFQEGLLLKGIYYSSGDGIWLTLDQTESNESPLLYHSHNADRRADDRLWLLRAFEAWVYGACVRLNWG